MARFLKQSFTQTCLKETDNGKLQQFNYFRSLITNRGTVERGKIHSTIDCKLKPRVFIINYEYFVPQFSHLQT